MNNDNFISSFPVILLLYILFVLGLMWEAMLWEAVVTGQGSPRLFPYLSRNASSWLETWWRLKGPSSHQVVYSILVVSEGEGIFVDEEGSLYSVTISNKC